jgi:O-methyltransferase domain
VASRAGRLGRPRGLDRPARPLDVLGVPVLPPTRITAITTRVRAALAAVHRATAPPPVRILESLFGLLDHAALVTLCELGVPDHLTARTSLDALATRIGAHRDTTERLIRYAATRGWVRLDRHGDVQPNATTRFLARSHPGGWRGWVDLMCGAEVAAAARALTTAVRHGGDAFATANGMPFFEWNAVHAERGAAFDAAMAAGGRMHGLALAHAIDWTRDRVVCDVGGGDGSLLEVLVRSHAHLSGVLLELPTVSARVTPRVADVVDVISGDAFAAVPGGASTYLLVNVVHDWPDDAAARLLTTIVGAAPRNARIVVVEGVRRRRPRDDVTHRTDLLMLLLAPGGRERSREEIDALARAAGLVMTRAVRLATGDVAYVLVRTPTRA